MGWMYLVVCVTDFLIFPILHAWLQVHYGTATLEWNPLTLKGGGLFHVAMGAVLGVAAWSRGQEKITKYQTGYYNRSGMDMAMVMSTWVKRLLVTKNRMRLALLRQ